MTDIVFAFETVFPLLVYMLVGMLVKYFHIAEESALAQMNNLVFKIFIPMSIARNIINAELGATNMAPVLLYAVVMVTVVFLLAWVYFAWQEPVLSRRSVMIQNAFRSNFVLFGLPLTQMILSGRGTGVTEVLIAVVVPLFNVYAVFILQYYGEGKMNVKSLIKGIFTNPLIVAAILSLIYKATFGTLPSFLEKPVHGMAQVATPLALIILGARFHFQQTVEFRKHIVLGVLTRLLVVPAVFLGLAVLLGFRGEVLVAFLAISASPVAVACYSMAQGMGADHRLAGQLLIYNSLLCSFSLFVFIFLLRTWAFI